MTAFFVPGVDPERAEARWLELADFVDAPVVGPADRVRSVLFTHGAEEWTATVGERLSGRLAARTDRPGRRTSSRSAPSRDVSDTATVLAILDTGDAYHVVTNQPSDSTFDSPFPIARRDTRRVRRFGD